jgi:hypothetical protein
MTKKRIYKNIGFVYPCKECGNMPEQGAAFIYCPNGHYESASNYHPGEAVRDWNRVNQPYKYKSSIKRKK